MVEAEKATQLLGKARAWLADAYCNGWNPIAELCDTLNAALQRETAVRALHTKMVDEGGDWCEGCVTRPAGGGVRSLPWPCPTIRALDGEVDAHNEDICDRSM